MAAFSLNISELMMVFEPVKIAYLLPGTALSGGVKVVFEQAFRLNRLPFFECWVIAKGKYPYWLRLAGVPFVNADPSLYDLSRFDIIVTTFFTQGEIHDRWSRKIVLHFCQGYEGDYADEMNRSHLKGEIERFYGRNMTVLTVNEHTRSRLLSVGVKRVVKVGQAFDKRIFSAQGYSAGDLPNRVLIVGQYDLPFKGVREGLELARMLKEGDRNLMVARVSPVDTKREEEMALGMNIDEYHVGVAPPEMAELYRSSALTIYLARKEGFGLPFLESIACGTPVIGSDIPPFREIVGYGYPLVSVEETDSQLSLAKRLMRDGPFRDRMVSLGLRRAKGFSYFKVIPKLAVLFVGLGVKRRMQV